MPSADDVYIHCDQLDRIPLLHRENWEFELALVVKKLLPDSSVLQVGCMDGTRMIRLLERRPDLRVTGLEIEEGLVQGCRDNLKGAGMTAEVTCGDITNPPKLPYFDYVLCLNNTLGYISDQDSALHSMHALGKCVIISVYGERFTDALAWEYFASIGVSVTSMEGTIIHLKDFTDVRRYTKEGVDAWHGTITETPIGYFCEI